MMIRDGNTVRAWGLVRQPHFKSVGQVEYFNPLARLGPPGISHSQRRPITEQGRLARITQKWENLYRMQGWC